MTKKKDLKALVRARMEKTGESYMVAKRAVTATAVTPPLTGAASIAAGEDQRTLEELLQLANKRCPTEYGECVLLKGHRSDEHGDDHQQADGTWWNVGKMMDPLCERCGTLMADGGSVGFYCPKKGCLPEPAKPTPTEAMKRAFEAWGVTVGKDAKLTTRDGKVLKTKWTSEVAQDLMAFHSGSAEVEMARLTLDAVFLALYGEDKPSELAPGVPENPDPNKERTFLVWESEYPDEGSTEIQATSEEDAKARWRKETGSDDDLELTVALLTPEIAAVRQREDERRAKHADSAHYQTLPCGHEVQIAGFEFQLTKFKRKFGVNGAAELQRHLDKELERHKSRECLKRQRVGLGVRSSVEGLAPKMSDSEILGLLRFNPSPDGDDSNFFGKGYERLACGHLVMNPDSQQMKDAAMDLRAFHGVEAEKELRDAALHERLQHSNGECLKPGWAQKSQSEAQAGAKLLEDLVAKKALEVKPIENEVQLVAVPGFDQPMSPEAAKSIEALRAKAREEIQAEAVLFPKNLVMSSGSDPQKDLENLRSQFIEPPKEVAYLDSETFALVKLEPLPCGHALRRNTEIPEDLRALYGSVGVEAFEHILEGERQKHLSGRCAEAINDLRLVPRYDIDKHRMTMALIDDKGQLLYPKTGNFVVPPEEPTSTYEVTITLNGKRVLVLPFQTYESLVRLAGLPQGPLYTMTYRRGQFQGTLTPNSEMHLSEDLIFNVVDTSSA